VEALGHLGSDALETLAAALKRFDDGDAQVRWLAAEAAVRIAGPLGNDGRIVLGPLEKLSRHPDSRLRE
jgi:hypothetical protein